MQEEVMTLENAVRRGDELYDQLCFEQKEVTRLMSEYDGLADRLREQFEENLRLQVLLTKHGIDFDID